MGELIVRRNRGMAVPRYPEVSRTEKQSGTAPPRQTADRAAATVSETLRQLMSRVDQTERQAAEGRRMLQTGEASLAEVEENLERMERLAREAAEDGGADRAALQTEWEQLRGEIDRIARTGTEAGLFQEGAAEEADALADAVMEGLSARQEETARLPSWLTQNLSGGIPDQEKLLKALGVDRGADSAQLLAALGRLPLERSPAAGYLAALYLGAVLSGGAPSGAADPQQAAAGLQLLLAAIAGGTSPDEAIQLLSGGLFDSLADFQAQFTGGTAPGLDAFLTAVLLAGEAVPELPSLLDLLAGGGDGMDLLMDLLAALDRSGESLPELPAGAETPGGAEAAENAPPQMETREFGAVQAAGRDLSGAVLDPESGELSVSGTEDLVLRGLEQERGQGQAAPPLRLAGQGTVTLQQVTVPQLTAESAQSRAAIAGEAAVTQIQLKEGAVLTLGGGGLLRVGGLSGEASGVLRLTGGAVELGGEAAQAVSVVVDGPVSLLAPAGTAVFNAQGKPLEPFDILWKALLPEWGAVTSLSVDGKQGQLALRTDGQMELARIWLLKGDDSQGYPAHTVVLQGRDRAGRLRTQSLHVQWEQHKAAFQEVSMYPNPFTVTGGEPELDWRYEEASQTLWILSGQVTGIAGGTGTDANQQPFSGRIALAGGIGPAALTLNGVTCRVSSGRAFFLGRENSVTLLLQRGSENVFESGEGCAGITLGEGTSLRIDQTKSVRGEPDGKLIATGGSGGSGIGRDSGAGRERTGTILIRGGVIYASGAGGGAGIGGALGAPVGDIRIQGGTITAQAACCAAAIGAGIQGACGDIVISGSARVVKARGGGPDGDIGGCLFGNCGKVQVSASANLGGAKLWTQKGLSIQIGDTSVTVPRFRISAQALRLDGLSLSTREEARSAMVVLAADRRWVSRFQGSYGAMYGQLGQTFSSLYSAHQSLCAVRSAKEAGVLLLGMREVLRQTPAAAFLSQRESGDVGQLLR